MGEKSPFQSQAHYCIASRWIIHVCAKCGIVTSFCNETMENKKLDVAEDKSVKSKPYTRPKKKKKKPWIGARTLPRSQNFAKQSRKVNGK